MEGLKLKMYMVEKNQQKLDSATKLGHYYEVYKNVSMVIEQF